MAVAALEPHFAAHLCAAAGVPQSDMGAMFQRETRQAIGAFFAARSRAELDELAAQQDLPLHTMQ